MNEFDIKAARWDESRIHRDRAETIAREIAKQIPLNRRMTAMEYGAGTGLLSFLLKDSLGSITLIDSSEGMVRVASEKIRESGATNLIALNMDLGSSDYSDKKFDIIYTLMALHHVSDVRNIIRKFYDHLSPGGFLAIADLYSEDGSFHGEGFTGHKGFDTGVLAGLLRDEGFTGIRHRTVYVIEKITSGNEKKQFKVFLMTAGRPE